MLILISVNEKKSTNHVGYGLIDITLKQVYASTLAFPLNNGHKIPAVALGTSLGHFPDVSDSIFRSIRNL